MLPPPQPAYPYMLQTTLIERVRLLFQREISELTGHDGSPIETLLLRDGLYCGRRFELGEHQAVWFIEEDQVKFYGPRGELLRSLRASQIATAEQSERHSQAA